MSPVCHSLSDDDKDVVIIIIIIFNLSLDSNFELPEISLFYQNPVESKVEVKSWSFEFDYKRNLQEKRVKDDS